MAGQSRPEQTRVVRFRAGHRKYRGQNRTKRGAAHGRACLHARFRLHAPPI